MRSTGANGGKTSEQQQQQQRQQQQPEMQRPLPIVNHHDDNYYFDSTSQGYSFYMWDGASTSDSGISLKYISNLSKNHRIRQVSCGHIRCKEERAHILTTDGDLFEWNVGREERGDKNKCWYNVDHNRRIVSDEVVLDNVTSIVSGKGYYVAINSSGEVYVWGIHVKREPGKDTIGWSYQRKPMLMKRGLPQGIPIKQVGVGWGKHKTELLVGYCIIALTTAGNVYSWGKHQFGMTGLGQQTGEIQEPTKVCFPGSETSGLEEIVQIATFQHHSAAITSNGSLYTWGCGGSGRLGHGNQNNCLIPTRLIHGMLQPHNNKDDNMKVKQVACGAEHTIVLTTCGKVLAFGSNASGQLGQGKKSQAMYLKPTLVAGLANYDINKVACGTESSCAITQNGELFRWGSETTSSKMGNENENDVVLWEPALVDCFRNQRVEEIQCFGTTIAALVTPQSDYIPLTKAFYSCVNNANDYDDDQFSDVTFIVENEPIRAHRIILARRCEFFHKMFTSGMRESTQDTIPLFGISKPTFQLLLHYLYTDEIRIDITNVLGLYRAGDMFGLPKLQDACVEAVQNKLLTIPQCATFLQQAHDHEQDCLELKAIAMSFVLENFAAVSQTVGMNEVSAELLLEIVQGFELSPKYKGRG